VFALNHLDYQRFPIFALIGLMLPSGSKAGRGSVLYGRFFAPLAAALALLGAGCTTFDTNTDDVVTFVFTQPTTECEVFVGNASQGRVSISRSAIGIPRSDQPLRLSCGAASFAPISAEVSIERARDEKVDVLGVGVPTPRALGARVTEPVANLTPRGVPTLGPTDKTGYPPRITVDIAQRAVIVPPGWQSRM